MRSPSMVVRVPRFRFTRLLFARLTIVIPQPFSNLLEEGARAAGGMQDRINALEGEAGRLGEERKEANLTAALLEDDLERKEGELEGIKAKLKGESNKMTLVRQRLSPVEK